jgi:hypothetical protein
MRRMLSIHAVVVALLVAGCSARPTNVDDTRSIVRRKFNEEGNKPPQREDVSVAKTETDAGGEHPEDGPAKKKGLFCAIKREGRKILDGTANYGYDLAMAAFVGATVGLIVAIVFAAGAQ